MTMTTTTTMMAMGDNDDEVDDDCDGVTRANDDLWGAGGSALSLEGRRRRPTCGRPHWSCAFNNAGNGTGTSRGGGGAKRCDTATSWHEQRGGVEDGCVWRLPDKM
jgi:hypothetical protein